MLIKVLHLIEALCYCGKVRYARITILQLKIANQMNNTELKYTIKWIKSFNGLENLSDEEALNAIASLQELKNTILELNSQNLNDLENENLLQQAA